MSITVRIPDTINDIPLDKYEKYAKLDLEKAEQDFINRKVLSIFYDIGPDQYTNMSVIDVGVLVNGVLKVLNEQPSFTPKFKHHNIEWGFIPNLDKITYGEFVDLQSVEGDMLKMMAVLYRPITKTKGDNYKIQSYKGYNKNIELLKDMPLSVVVGSLAFFFDLWKSLLMSTLNSLGEVVTDQNVKQSLGKSGDGIHRFLQLQMESLERLMKLHPLTSIKLSSSLVTPAIGLN